MSAAASIIIPTYGRRASLLRVLRALGRQTVPADQFEVVVICDGDSDGSAAACRALGHDMPYSLRVVIQDNQGPAAARNRGIAEATAPLIVFIDDDVIPDEDLLEAHLRAQQGHLWRVTIGPLLPPPGLRLNPWGEWEEQTLCRQYDDMAAGRWEPTYRQFYSGNASVLKRHVIAAGGFNSAYRRAEDVELGLRLREQGLHFTFLPQARGWHYVRRSFDSWLRIPTGYGLADVAMARAGYWNALAIVADEFPRRNAAVRALTRLCVGRPTLVKAVTTALRLPILMVDAAGFPALGCPLCGLIFNIRYYDGLTSALGKRADFKALINKQPATELLRRHNMDRASEDTAS